MLLHVQLVVILQIASLVAATSFTEFPSPSPTLFPTTRETLTPTTRTPTTPAPTRNSSEDLLKSFGDHFRAVDSLSSIQCAKNSGRGASTCDLPRFGCRSKGNVLCEPTESCSDLVTRDDCLFQSFCSWENSVCIPFETDLLPPPAENDQQVNTACSLVRLQHDCLSSSGCTWIKNKCKSQSVQLTITFDFLEPCFRYPALIPYCADPNQTPFTARWVQDVLGSTWWFLDRAVVRVIRDATTTVLGGGNQRIISSIRFAHDQENRILTFDLVVDKNKRIKSFAQFEQVSSSSTSPVCTGKKQLPTNAQFGLIADILSTRPWDLLPDIATVPFPPGRVKFQPVFEEQSVPVLNITQVEGVDNTSLRYMAVGTSIAPQFLILTSSRSNWLYTNETLVAAKCKLVKKLVWPLLVNRGEILSGGGAKSVLQKQQQEEAKETTSSSTSSKDEYVEEEAHPPAPPRHRGLETKRECYKDDPTLCINKWTPTDYSETIKNLPWVSDSEAFKSKVQQLYGATCDGDEDHVHPMIQELKSKYLTLNKTLERVANEIQTSIEIIGNFGNFVQSVQVGFKALVRVFNEFLAFKDLISFGVSLSAFVPFLAPVFVTLQATFGVFQGAVSMLAKFLQNIGKFDSTVKDVLKATQVMVDRMEPFLLDVLKFNEFHSKVVGNYVKQFCYTSEMYEYLPGSDDYDGMLPTSEALNDLIDATPMLGPEPVEVAEFGAKTVSEDFLEAIHTLIDKWDSTVGDTLRPFKTFLDNAEVKYPFLEFKFDSNAQVCGNVWSGVEDLLAFPWVPKFTKVCLPAKLPSVEITTKTLKLRDVLEPITHFPGIKYAVNLMLNFFAGKVFPSVDIPLLESLDKLGVKMLTSPAKQIASFIKAVPKSFSEPLDCFLASTTTTTQTLEQILTKCDTGGCNDVFKIPCYLRNINDWGGAFYCKVNGNYKACRDGTAFKEECFLRPELDPSETFEVCRKATCNMRGGPGDCDENTEACCEPRFGLLEKVGTRKPNARGTPHPLSRAPTTPTFSKEQDFVYGECYPKNEQCPYYGCLDLGDKLAHCCYYDYADPGTFAENYHVCKANNNGVCRLNSVPC